MRTADRPRVPRGPVCQSCGVPLEVFLDHGMQPVANGFRWPADTTPEPTYPIRYGFCPECYLVQLIDQPPAELLFPADYAYLTGASEGMRSYYAAFAAAVRARWRPRKVLEVGCNDGTLLQHFLDLDHLGIEPSAKVAALARSKGCTVWETFWSPEVATLPGFAPDLLLACHVLTHLPRLAVFFAAANQVLAPNGVIVLEDPSLDRIVSDGEFDQAYDEHAVLLSLPALQRVAEPHGFELIDVEPQEVHGGSYRVTVARAGVHPVDTGVAKRVRGECYLTQPWTFRTFGETAAGKIAHLRALLLSLRQNGHRIAAYGAASKLTLVLNRLHLPPGTIEYVTDTTPTKVGKLMPGTHEPIISRDDAEVPDYFVLGAWVHRREIAEKERAYLEAGGKFIVWNPHVHAFGAEVLAT